jgi:hypothetical protein
MKENNDEESLNAYSSFGQPIPIPSPAPNQNRRHLPAHTQNMHDFRVRYFHAIMPESTTRTWRCLILLLLQMALLSMDCLGDDPTQVTALGITRRTLRISPDNVANLIHDIGKWSSLRHGRHYRAPWM